MSLIGRRPHTSKLTQCPGMSDERIIDNVPSFHTPSVSVFDLEPRVRVGDLIESEYFDEPMRVTKVERYDLKIGGIPPYQQVKVSPARAEEVAKSSPPALTQNFHGNVGAVAGRDVNVSVSVFLDAIAKHIESAPISETEKKTIVSQFRKLAENPIVAGLATNAIWQIMTTLGS